MNTYVLKQRTVKGLCYLFLILLFVICMLPIYILLINATRASSDIVTGVTLIPGTQFLANWRTLTVDFGINIWLGVRNSLIVAFSSTFLSIYFSLLTAYAINVYNFKFKRVFYGIIVAMVLVPGSLFLIGSFQYFNALGILNTFAPLIIPSIAAPGTVFFMKQYLEAAIVPELIQAARIDGAGEFTIFNRIALPLAAPGAFTFAIFAFVGSWNAFMGPLFFIGGNQNIHTLPLIMNRLQADAYLVDFGAIYFSMAVTLLPIIAVYAIFSRYIVAGIALGSVKE